MVKLKPSPLNPGATIAVLSPSWGGPSIFPHIYKQGLNQLTSLGFNVKEYPTARMAQSKLKRNPEFRAKDINDAFADKKVSAIFATIGGEDSIKVLPFIDTKIVLENPKIIMGFSDTDTLLIYLNQLGLVAFHGPSIMAGFSQMAKLPQGFKKHFKTFFFTKYKSLSYKKYPSYCDGYPDWKDIKNTGKINRLKTNLDGWHWLRGKKTAKGQLFGGCIEVLEQMKETTFWPDNHFWDNKILFFETSEDKPSLKIVKRYLEDYKNRGIFNKLRAVLFGRARDFSAQEKKELDTIITEVVGNNFPLVSNMDFGHTDPQLILPLGIKAEVDPMKHEISLIEYPFTA